MTKGVKDQYMTLFDRLLGQLKQIPHFCSSLNSNTYVTKSKSL